MTAALMDFLFFPRTQGWLAWVPGILYLLPDNADLLEFLDSVTNLANHQGEILDMSLNGLGVMVTALITLVFIEERRYLGNQEKT